MNRHSLRCTVADRVRRSRGHAAEPLHDDLSLGSTVVAPGYTDGLKFVDGDTYGVSHVTGATNDAPLDDATNNPLDHVAQRVITVAGRLKA